MSSWTGWALLLVFAAHLVAFTRLWLRRRQGYYVALMVTFTLLVVWVTLGLWGEAPVIAGRPLGSWVRFAAWGAALVSVSWTAARIRRRIQEGRQNCS